MAGPEPVEICRFHVIHASLKTVNESTLYVEESPLLFDGDKLSCLAIKLLHICFCESKQSAKLLLHVRVLKR